MPHTDSSLQIYSFAKEHKKRFNFVLSASAPLGVRNLVANWNLTTVIPVRRIGRFDAFRYHFNAFWVGFGDNRQFGISTGTRDLRVINFHGTSPQLNYGTGQDGYGLSIVPQVDTDGFQPTSLENIFNWVDATADAPLGAVSPTVSAQSSISITGSRKTKQDFRIAIAAGGKISHNNRSTFKNMVPGPERYWWDQRAWQQFVNDNILGTFEDLSFEMWWPFPEDQIQSASPIKNIYVDIKPSYNFYVPEYEVEAKAPQVPSTLLPNVYVFASEADESFVDADDSRFKQHIGLNGKISDVFVDILNEKGEKIGEKDKGQYFEKWGRAYAATSTPSDLTTLATKYENLVFPMSNLNLIKDNQGKEKLFPMHIKIDFSTDTNTRFADAMQHAKLSTALIKKMINSEESPNYWKEEGAAYDFKGWNYDPLNYTQDYQETWTFDLAKWMDTTLGGTSRSPFEKLLDRNPFNGIFLGPLKEEVLAAADPRFDFFISLMMIQFRSELDKIVTEKFRSFKDLLRGKLAYSETVVYKIERQTTTDNGVNWESTNEPNIWFPNSSEIDVLSYTDTQIKYGVSYRYIIYAYQLVIGNKYQYALNDMPTGEDDFYAKLCLFNEPTIRLVKVPYYDSLIDHPKGIKMIDSPPVPPDVNIVPYAGVDNKILIWLNSNVGDYLLPDIRILTDDDNDRNNLEHRDEDGSVAQLLPGESWTRNNISDTLIRFKTDDPVSEFEIFRLSKRPKKFSDFAAMGDPWIVSAPSASSAAFIDTTIRPNRKYYYIFRAKDNHGHTSNPTAVYEVELVKDNENVYSLINTIDMSLTPDRQITKPGRKFIQIKPSFLQSTLNEKYLSGKNSMSSIDPEDVFEKNPPVKSVWGSGNDDTKKFKIRINSKKTGKKFDINVKFKIVKKYAAATKFSALIAGGKPPN